MSSEQDKAFPGAADLPAPIQKETDFTRELLAENERLREELAQLADRQQGAVRKPHDWEELRQELRQRIDTLEAECTTVRERLDQVERENQQFAERYVEMEEENNNLANLYVASYQLHSTLDLDEVLNIIREIVTNLVGADTFAIYLLDEETRELRAVVAEGLEVSEFPSTRLGSGVLGEAAASTETTCFEVQGEGGDLERPIVCVPLRLGDRPLGAIAAYSLLGQKGGAFSALDRELFDMLGGRAATAIFAAKLYSQSERKLNTIQSFIDLLTK